MSEDYGKRTRRATMYGWLTFGFVVLAIAAVAYSCAAAGNGDAAGPGGGWALAIAALTTILAIVSGWVWNNLRGGSNGPY
jgi:hypothetical protein